MTRAAPPAARSRASAAQRTSAPPAPVSLGLFPLLVSLLVPAALFVALAWRFAPNTVDDAWITFRYARQWALGHGPVFNPGEPVEGYSNLLLVLLLTPVIAVGGAGAALPAAKAIGLASGVLSVIGAGVLARRGAGGAPWVGAAALAAAGLVAVVPGFAYHAMSGLETALYACLLVWGAVGLASSSGRTIVLGGCSLAAAAITRPEGPALFALGWLVVAIARLARARRVPAGPAPTGESAGWRPLLVAGLLGAVAILGQGAFRYATYAEWVPNTYFAKIGGSGDRVRYVQHALRSPFLGPLGLLVAGLGAFVGGRAPLAWWVAALLGTAGALLPLATGSDWMHGGRLVMPYVPLLAAAVVCGWGRLAAAATRGSARITSVLLLLAVPLAFALQAGLRDGLARVAAVESAGARSGHSALAAWLAREAKPGDEVVLMDVGEIGYHAIEQRILDVTGLTDRTIAKSPGTFMAKQFDPAYVFDRRPEFIVLTFFGRDQPGAPLHPFSEMETRLLADPAFASDYRRVPDPGAEAATDIELTRQAFGAEAVFPYATPDQRYLLAVFRRSGQAPR